MRVWMCSISGTAGAVSLPEIPAPEAVLNLAFERGDVVSYSFEWSYGGFGRVPFEAGSAAVRDPAAESEKRALLESVWQEYQEEGVSFVGVNTFDEADTAKAFAETYGVTYPSLMDAKTGTAKLAFAGATPIQATPTTLVLDKQGRVAARIIGQLESASILETLVKDALAESA